MVIDLLIIVFWGVPVSYVCIFIPIQLVELDGRPGTPITVIEHFTQTSQDYLIHYSHHTSTEPFTTYINSPEPPSSGISLTVCEMHSAMNSIAAHKPKGGRPSDPLVDTLIIPYPDPTKPQSTRHKCRWCPETFAARNTVRARKHAAFECPGIPGGQRDEVKVVLERRDMDGRRSSVGSAGGSHCATCTCVLHECFDERGVRVVF